MLFIERQKKALKIFCYNTLCTKIPFGYQVAHHEYLLTSFPGHKVKKNQVVISILLTIQLAFNTF